MQVLSHGAMNESTRMAAMLWNDYKARMGHSEGIDMQFNLSTLLRLLMV
jgi:hypothetical protein